jgi:hypothetical protein
MRQLLAALAICAGGIAVWALTMLFGKTKLAPREQVHKEPWEESLEIVMKSGGVTETYAIRNAAHTMAMCLANLTRRIEEFSASNERLSKINLLVVCVIAVATVVYAVASLMPNH